MDKIKKTKNTKKSFTKDNFIVVDGTSYYIPAS